MYKLESMLELADQEQDPEKLLIINRNNKRDINSHFDSCSKFLNKIYYTSFTSVIGGAIITFSGDYTLKDSPIAGGVLIGVAGLSVLSLAGTFFIDSITKVMRSQELHELSSNYSYNKDRIYAQKLNQSTLQNLSPQSPQHHQY